MKSGYTEDEKYKEIIKSYVKLIELVVENNSNCFDYVSYVGQCGYWPLFQYEDEKREEEEEEVVYNKEDNNEIVDENSDLVYSKSLNILMIFLLL